MPRKPGASAIVMFRGKILLILRDDKPTIPSPNTWNAPGGGIEEGETPQEAVKRELLEEISVVPEDLQSTGMTTYEDGSVVYRFFAKLSEEESKSVRLGDEGQKLDWFTYDEVMAAKLSPRFRRYFESQKIFLRKSPSTDQRGK